MVTVRWIRGDKDRTNVKDENFDTRGLALAAIERESVSSISRFGRIYAVVLKR